MRKICTKLTWLKCPWATYQKPITKVQTTATAPAIVRKYFNKDNINANKTKQTKKKKQERQKFMANIFVYFFVALVNFLMRPKIYELTFERCFASLSTTIKFGTK